MGVEEGHIGHINLLVSLSLFLRVRPNLHKREASDSFGFAKGVQGLLGHLPPPRSDFPNVI
jgi:hypothetical protein